jgi:hypothetical protein
MSRLACPAFYTAVFLLYLLFPTVNHSVDAWGFAADARYGLDLFQPHHLLNGITFYIFAHLLSFLSAIRASLLLNAIAGAFGIFILDKIFRSDGRSFGQNFSLLCIAAFSFGYWRYTTENETYILPIVFSLIGTLYYLKGIRSERLVFFALSGFFCAFACLYHQLQFWWWIGLAVGILFFCKKERIKAIAAYTTPALIVPAAYCLAAFIYAHQPVSLAGLLHFVFEDYYNGSAGVPFRAEFIILSAINLVRTFYQVHGSIIFLLKNHLWLWMVPVVTLVLIVLAKIHLIRQIKSLKIAPLFYLFASLLIVYFFFAAYSGGNAEFMVSMPVIAVIALSFFRPVPLRSFNYFALSLLVWNFAMGIIPNHFLPQNANAEVAKFVFSNPQVRFITDDAGTVNNIIYYHTGKLPDNILLSPSWYPDKGVPVQALLNQTDSLLSQNVAVYTDEPPHLASRKTMLAQSVTDAFLSHYRLKQVYSFPTPYGPHRILRLFIR